MAETAQPGGGTPHLHIFVNRRKFEEGDGVTPEMTGAQIAALVEVPADNAVINVDTPRSTMALVDDMQAIWECDVRGIYQPKTFTAVEVFS